MWQIPKENNIRPTGRDFIDNSFGWLYCFNYFIEVIRRKVTITNIVLNQCDVWKQRSPHEYARSVTEARAGFRRGSNSNRQRNAVFLVQSRHSASYPTIRSADRKMRVGREREARAVRSHSFIIFELPHLPAELFGNIYPRRCCTRPRRLQPIKEQWAGFSRARAGDYNAYQLFDAGHRCPGPAVDALGTWVGHPPYLQSRQLGEQ